MSPIDAETAEKERDDHKNSHWRMHVHTWLAGTPGGQPFFRMLLAVALGVGAGYGSLLFRWLIIGITKLWAGAGGLAAVSQLPWWRKVFPPAIGGALVGPLVHFLAPEAKGHGVPEVKDACTNLGGRMRARVTVIKTAASGICIGSGGSVGREGPIVQIGASLGSVLASATGFRGQYVVDFAAAGAAAGIAATFNAPIAGVMFAIEIILGRSSPRHFTPLVVAAVIATAITHYHLGASPAFSVPAWTLVSGWELPLYLVLGGLAGCVGVAFTRILYWIEDLWEMLPLPPYTHGVLGGLTVGAVALYFPQVLGVGYQHIDAVLAATTPSGELTSLAVEGYLLLLVVAKIFSTSTTIGSGGSGGIFAPSLFVGCSLGGSFGGFAGRFFPRDMIANPSAYALVGMGAMVAATTHAPLTAILIVFELCDRHSIVLPLMLSSIVGTTIAMRVFKESIYTLKLARRGAKAGNDESPVEMVCARQVSEIMLASPARVRANGTLDQIVERAHDADAQQVYVTDHQRRLQGFVTLEDVAAHIKDSAATRKRLRARDLLHAAEVVYPHTPLDACMDLLRQKHRTELPVVDEDRRLIGRVSRGDLLAFFSREVLRQEAVLSLTEEEGTEEPSQEVIMLESGEVRAEIPVGQAWAGQSLRELNLRTRYGVNVYAIRTEDGVSHTPDPEAPLAVGDVLITIGPRDEIDHLREERR